MYANDVIEFLRTTEDDESSLTVNGIMGLPDFNGAGARTSLPGVYCIDFDPEGTDNAMTYFPDVLRYEPETQTLSGDDPCSIDGFMAEEL